MTNNNRKTQLSEYKWLLLLSSFSLFHSLFSCLSLSLKLFVTRQQQQQQNLERPLTNDSFSQRERRLKVLSLGLEPELGPKQRNLMEAHDTETYQAEKQSKATPRLYLETNKATHNGHLAQYSGDIPRIACMCAQDTSTIVTVSRELGALILYSCLYLYKNLWAHPNGYVLFYGLPQERYTHLRVWRLNNRS